MNAVLTRDSPTIREALWAHPEWWVIGLGIVSWVSIVRDGIAQWGHSIHHRAGLGAELFEWHVMVLAMMAPAIALQARAIALRSFAERRHWAIAGFLVGYLAPWSALGVAAAAARLLPWSHSTWAMTGLCAAATAWAILSLRDRAMMMVHGYAPVIAPTGYRATWDCTRSGLVVGAWCVASCWLLMLACALSGHNLAALAAGGAISLAEINSFRPPRRFVILVLTALTAFFAVR